jgi:hypothetical protein
MHPRTWHQAYMKVNDQFHALAASLRGTVQKKFRRTFLVPYRYADIKYEFSSQYETKLVSISKVKLKAEQYFCNV